MNNKGYIALIVVLVVTAVALSVGMSISISAIRQTQMSFAKEQSHKALTYAEGCAQEGLQKFKDSWEDISGTLEFADGECIYSAVVDIEAGNAILSVSGEVSDDTNSYTRSITIDVDENLNVTSWEEG